MEITDWQCNGCRKYLPQMDCKHEWQWRDLEKKLRDEIVKEVKEFMNGREYWKDEELEAIIRGSK